MTRVQARELLLVEGDAEVKRVVESIRFLSKERETADADFEKTLLTENGRKVFGHYKTGMEEYSKLVDEVIQDVSAGNKAKALAVNKAKEPDLARRAQEGTDELVRLKVDIAKTTAQENARIAARAVTLTIVALAVGLIVAIGLALLATRSVTAPLKDSVTMLEAISKGDLSHEVPEAMQSRRDEAGDLARAMQRMTQSLRKLVEDISGGVRTLASSSTELSAISGQTAEGVKAMSDKASTVAAAAEEMSTNTVSVAGM